MAPRSSWKGFIKLSLVSVPVKAFTANDTSAEIHLNQLDKDTNSRIRYKRVNAENQEVRNEDIVSGYEYAKDQYVIIDPQEVSKLRTESDRSIAIDGFVRPDRIDPIYFSGKTYYLLPDGRVGSRPYSLLRQGMVDEDVVAVAQIVLSGREQLVMLRPAGKLLMMTVLHYYKKVKSADEFEGDVEDQRIARAELQLTKTLIEASKIERFDLSAYKDKYVENLGRLIEMKVAGEEIVSAPAPEEPKIINLMEALKKSVAEAQAAKKMAPSVTEPAATKQKKARKKKTG